ncbi:MAG: M48 family metallopeptidase [Gammaproteobacteria bacterium]|nr:M48 family metallopeptidase [Gammaproteobacteria bacterium]
MNATDIRCSNDLALYEKLIKHRDVVRVNDQIARHEADGPTRVRRSLLATSVRLTASMAPDIARTADECIEKLGVKIPLELFVYSSPQFNAACFKPENDRLYVMFSSSLLEGFSKSELKFVMGHELGHHVYNHHAIPIGYLLRGNQRPDPQLALELFAWSRYAEISADRAGAHCAQDMDAVARSLFKLSSGLTTKIVEFSLDDFVAQADDISASDQEPGQGAPQSDWFSTHPFSPLRVKALKLFEKSELYSGKDSVADLEVGVQSVLSLMEPSYLEAKTDTAETMRRLLFAGLIAVADAHAGISVEELEVFAKFFGKYAFSEKLNIDKIKQTVADRALEVKDKASETQRMQVLRDMCLMATADGGVHASEREVLDGVAEKLEISVAFIDQALQLLDELD